MPLVDQIPTFCSMAPIFKEYTQGQTMISLLRNRPICPYIYLLWAIKMNKMHPFKKYILEYNPLGKEEWQRIENCLTRKEYKKGEVILESGKICRKLYFLEEGFLRFFIFRDGETISKFFTEPPYCFTSQRSFTNGIPTDDNIEALKDSIVWEMTKTDAFDLLGIPNWSEFIRKLIQEVQYYTEQILVEAQNNSAEERYIKMIEENSSILVNAPLKDIASYLGIAPQSLSRIRKKYWTNQRKLT